MREVTSHHTNEANRAITIGVYEYEDGRPFNYDCNWQERDGSGRSVEIPIQHGPIGEVGVNGLTLEVLLGIARDLLEYHQCTQYACVENRMALDLVTEAAGILEDRTRRRTAEGVEGTLQLDATDDTGAAP